MRAIVFLSLASLAACGHGRAWSDGHPAWEPFIGTYELTGSLTGSPSMGVTGTLILERGAYHLNTDHGSCDGKLARPPEGQVTLSCGSVGVVLKRAEGGFDTDGSVRVSVPSQQERTTCRTDASGTRVCTTREVSTNIGRSGRIRLRKLTAADGGPTA